MATGTTMNHHGYILFFFMYRLLARVRGTTLENLSEQASGPVSGIREIEELNESFSETRASLKASMDRLLETRQQEIKSRLMALQSQMNPHFYYNSLATIMISAQAFRSYIQPSLIEQAKHADNVLYHLDGKDCIRHLDALMP